MARFAASAGIGFALALAGCGDSSRTAAGKSAGGSEAPEKPAVALKGVGATFPEPLYSKWFKDYKKDHPEVQVFYQGKGSGAGITEFNKETVDFAASDSAMSDKEIAAVPANRGVALIPLTAGSVVVAYNLPDGPKELKLSREALAGIFLGKVKKWNDPAIAKANPDAKLPDTNVSVVTRADSSGTTFAFTSHLAAATAEWKAGPGAGKSVKFPVGVAQPKNDGVANHIKNNPGSVGYLEYGFATNNQLPMASLENKSGAFVAPNAKSGSAGLADVKLGDDLRGWADDPAGKDAYPIVTLTWVLVYKNYPDAKQAAALRGLLEYCLTTGQAAADGLGYLPLPENVAAAAKKAAAAIGAAKP